jgi:hypothetical protein
VVTTYVLGVLMYTQLNLANVVEMGLSVTFEDRMDAAIHDLAGMAAVYAPAISVALLLGFLIVGLVLRWVPQLRTLGYIVGGFTAMLAMEAIVTNLVTFHVLLPVARTTIGLLSQCLAGAIGAWVFVQLIARPETADQT